MNGRRTEQAFGPTESARIFVGLGSNLGAREANLNRAVEALAALPGVAVVARSSLFDTAPVGPPQPRYLNAVVELRCQGLAPRELWQGLKAVEKQVGRQEAPRWTARVIDLDLLLWGDVVVEEAALSVPHRELHRRRFVLEPLCELAPEVVHPVLKATISALLADVGAQDVVKSAVGPWPTPRGLRSGPSEPFEASEQSEESKR